MEQRFYKVRLVTGRVIGPIELDRVKQFIAKDKITGLEMVRLYPAGEWKDINSFPEIAELLMGKLEGKIKATDAKTERKSPSEQSANAREPDVEAAMPRASQNIESLGSITLERPATVTAADGERTVMMTADDEKTKLYTADDEPSTRKSENDKIELQFDEPEEIVTIDADPAIANEKTAMLTIPGKGGVGAKKGVLGKQKKIFLIAVLAIAGAIVLFLDDPKTKVKNEAPFVVEMPTMTASDPQQSEQIYKSALAFYAEDSVDGYKEAAKRFKKAAGLDANNVKALCFLASSYMNLIDVVNRDENYFNVITRLIEMARAKGVDLPEMVIADVELYNILGNPDAALTRILDYLNSHQWDPVMLYYLSYSHFMKGQYPEAMRYLSTVEKKDYFSPKVSYLVGLLDEKSGKLDDAIRSYEEALQRNQKHMGSHARLTELLFKKDNLQEAGKHADFVIFNKPQASKDQLAKAYYFRARMHEVAGRDAEALEDLLAALKNTPDDPDTLLESYTLRARMGAKVNDASGKARMFHFMALGEKFLKDNMLDEAMANFLTARDVQYDDATPLLRLAEVFKRKGDPQSAKVNLGKAVKAAPRNAEIYPKYINVLVECYEFEEAARVLAQYKELSPPSGTVDKLQGDLYTRQEKFREALVYYKRALGSSNADSGIYVAYANLMLKDSNYKDAAFYYGLALRFDPFNTEATIGIGKAFAEMQGVDRGVEYVQSAVGNSSHKAALLNGIAEIFLRKGDYNSALRFAENALATEQKFPAAYKTKGDAFNGQDKLKEALDAYQTYVNLNPVDPAGHIERYKIYLKKMDMKTAKGEMQQVIEMYPKYPGVYYMIGEIYRVAQDNDSALKASLLEIQNNPNFVPAYVLAGTVYNSSRDYNNALAVLNRALAINPNSVPALLQAATANQELKTYPAALTMLERALSLDAGNPQVHKRFAALYQVLGNREKMKQYLKSYLDLYPDAPDRGDAESLIAN